MTSIEIPDSDRRIQYTATAGQTVFPYDFPIYDDDDLVVKRTRSGTTTTLTKTTDYTVSGVGVEAGGNVTLVSGATLSDIMTIYGSAPIDRQGQNFQQSGDFLADDLNRQLNKQIIISQELQEQINNCVKLGEESTYSGSLALPTPTANKAILWNTSASALENSIDDFNNIVTNATTQAGIATTQATAAGVARVAAELAETNAEIAETNAEAAQTAAEAAQLLAEDWASKTNGQVTSTDYSSKAYAIGGTGVTSSIGAAKEWAITAENTPVTIGNYSALHHAAKAAASAAAAIVAKIEWQGPWSAGTYNRSDAVEHNGSSWICVSVSTTEEPSISATDWDLLALKGTDGTGSVTSVGATSPVASSGGATPVISLSAGYGDTLNPYASKTQKYVLAAPNAADGVPSFRALLASDIPITNQNTTGTASNVTGTVAIANGGTGLTASLPVVQQVRTEVTSMVTGSNVSIPWDDTKPQNTEGIEVMTLAITPKSSSNILKIDVVLAMIHVVGDTNMTAALFQDSTANSLAAASSYNTAAAASKTLGHIVFTHYMTAGTTSATTFKVRAGGAGVTGTFTFNGADGARKFGGVCASSIIITEYAA